MHNQIKIGFEFGTGEEVSIPISHTIWTGVTQLSGKTTGIESIVGRTGKRAVIFITKPGEESFQEGTRIKPFYRERSDWEFIKGLIESVMGYRIRSQEQAKIIQLTRESGGNNLNEFKKKLDEKLRTTKSDYKLDIYTNLHAYLEKIIPKIYEMDYTKELELIDGINIIDLEKFAENVEIQGLVIASVLDEVLVKYNDVIVVIPELWKFCPQDKGTPCKGSITSFARQGAARKNFLYFDSQELASTDKAPLKQCSTWVMGYQSERNEVKHTLDQLPVPKGKKPDVDKIMSLGTGEFFVATRDLVKKVFVQAFWVSDSDARDVAVGRKTMKDLPPRPKAGKRIEQIGRVDISKEKLHSSAELEKHLTMPEQIKAILDDLKLLWQGGKQIDGQIMDIYDRLKKVEKFSDQISDIYQNILEYSKNYGKIPIEMQENIIKLVRENIPESVGNNVVYTVSPIEKIKKEFLEEAKTKIMNDISELSEKAKRMLKYIESRGAGVPVTELCVKCFMMKDGTGGYAKNVNDWGKELIEKQIAKKHDNGKFMPMLKARIEELTKVHGATDEEIDNVYNHIIFEMLGDKK